LEIPSDQTDFYNTLTSDLLGMSNDDFIKAFNEIQQASTDHQYFSGRYLQDSSDNFNLEGADSLVTTT
jgi:hypothetical protein